MRLLPLLLALLLLASCAQAQPTEMAPPTPTAVATSEPTPPATLPPSPTPTVSHAPTPGAEPAPTPTPAPDSAYSRVLEGVAEVRGLDPTEAVVPKFMTREELADTLVDDLNENLEEILNSQALYKLLGLIPQDSDLRQLLLDLYTEQVAGFYDTETKELYMIAEKEGRDLTALEETTLAHEFVHALQQQHFDIHAGLEAVEDNSDAASAMVALVEGDASAAQSQYTLAHISRERQMAMAMEGSRQDISAFSSAPFVLQRSLLFPYIEGTIFVTELLASSSGWDAVDAAYGDPPASTEQILHPEKYLDREEPVQVSLPDVAAALGQGWEEVHADVMGEFFLRTYLEAHGNALKAPNAAAGWGGDAYTLLKGPDDEYALVTLIEWDTGKDAQKFFETMTASDSVAGEDFLGLEEDRMLWILSPSGHITEQIRALWPEF